MLLWLPTRWTFLLLLLLLHVLAAWLILPTRSLTTTRWSDTVHKQLGCYTIRSTRGVRRRHGLQMRDASASYWFSVGDQVKVVADNVIKEGTNLYGRRGRVVETWEKCDVDPTCCCAEQVDVNMAVRVEFKAEEDAEGTSLFHYYFGEDELVKLRDDELPGAKPFDGMSCKAFKLEALGIASREDEEIA